MSISSSRCTCGHCDNANLSSALEYRCCREIGVVSAKLAQEGSQELCITRHSDFSHLVNRTVLEQVAPLLKDRNGRAYRRRNQTEDEYVKQVLSHPTVSRLTISCIPACRFLRAVAYRWIIRWLCGHMGWGNSRSLPACVYQEIRTLYGAAQAQHIGYVPAIDRN